MDKYSVWIGCFIGTIVGWCVFGLIPLVILPCCGCD